MQEVPDEPPLAKNIIKHFGGLSSVCRKFFYPLLFPHHNHPYLLNKFSKQFLSTNAGQPVEYSLVEHFHLPRQAKKHARA